MIGKTYYLKGEPVVVLVKWRHVKVPKGVKGPPRNVLLQRADGTTVVRNFHGLRKNPPRKEVIA